MFRLRSTGRGQRGNATIEYALLLALIGLAAVAGLSLFGQSVSAEVGIVADELASLLGGGGSGAGGSAAGGQGNGNGHGSGNGGQNSGTGSGGQDNGAGNVK